MPLACYEVIECGDLNQRCSGGIIPRGLKKEGISTSQREKKGRSRQEGGEQSKDGVKSVPRAKSGLGCGGMTDS